MGLSWLFKSLECPLVLLAFRIILRLSCPNVFIGHPQAMNKLDSRYNHAGMTCASLHFYHEKWQFEPFMSNANRT
jgi:hypothetical protein